MGGEDLKGLWRMLIGKRIGWDLQIVFLTFKKIYKNASCSIIII